MSKTAIILGATGLTGSLLLGKLLLDERYTKIKVFGRTALNLDDPKIEEFVLDLLNLETEKANFQADELFCCIGTTKKKTPDEQMYHNIDFGIPVAAAKLAAANGIKTFVVISSTGSSAKSSVFYSRTKGEMEEAVLAEKLSNTYILRPSLIKGDRSEARPAERLMGGLMSFFNLLLIGSLKKYRSIKAERIAQAMINITSKLPKKVNFNSAEIQQFADQ
jgi:uncharacterized protein YbjT (DUF2867 family)